MNCNTVKATLNSTTCNKANKKYKKQKRKNKHKLYKLRLKKYKKKQSATKPLQVDSREIMSNWYWSNYKKAVVWRGKHEVAHWKACALALQEENRYLLGIINQMRPGMRPDFSVTWQNFQKRRNSPNVNAFNADNSDSTEDVEEDEQGSDEDVEFEMSEEMIQFFKESMRHKENLKKIRGQESAKRAEEEVKELQTNRLKRGVEMQLLYGEGASMIIGMETAVQLSYEKFCESKSPKYWPNIPFRL